MKSIKKDEYIITTYDNGTVVKVLDNIITEPQAPVEKAKPESFDLTNATVAQKWEKLFKHLGIDYV